MVDGLRICMADLNVPKFDLAGYYPALSSLSDSLRSLNIPVNDTASKLVRSLQESMWLNDISRDMSLSALSSALSIYDGANYCKCINDDAGAPRTNDEELQESDEESSDDKRDE